MNLMSSIIEGTGGQGSHYPPLRDLDPLILREYDNIVLLVFDGLGHDYLDRQVGRILHQHLKGKLTSVFPSTTASAITTYLTGDAPQQHAVTGWFMYLRELGTVMTVLLGSPRYGGVGLSRSGINTERLFGHVPLSNRVGLPIYIVTQREIACSDYNIAHQGTATTRVYETLDQMFTATAAVVHGRPKRKFIYGYWPGLDHVGHSHGIYSPRAEQHFRDIDAAFESFMEDIIGTGTVVVVTADHGMIDVSRDETIELDDHPDLGEMLTLPLCGERRVAYCYVRPDRRSAFEQYVTGELGDCVDLWPSRKLVNKEYFGIGEAHPRLGERIGDYTLIMKNRYVIKDWLPSEPRHVQIGVHGGTSDEEMYVPLIIVTT